MEKIKTIPTKIQVNKYLIAFEYETWKGHHRKTDKRLIKHINSEEAKKAFKKAAGVDNWPGYSYAFEDEEEY